MRPDDAHGREEVLHVARYEIDDPLRTVGIDAADHRGIPVRFIDLRHRARRPIIGLEDPEAALVLGRMQHGNPDDETFVDTEVVMPGRLVVARTNTLSFLARHRGTLEVVGSVALVLAASTGLAVRRRRGK